MAVQIQGSASIAFSQQRPVRLAAARHPGNNNDNTAGLALIDIDGTVLARSGLGSRYTSIAWSKADSIKGEELGIIAASHSDGVIDLISASKLLDGQEQSLLGNIQTKINPFIQLDFSQHTEGLLLAVSTRDIRLYDISAGIDNIVEYSKKEGLELDLNEQYVSAKWNKKVNKVFGVLNSKGVMITYKVNDQDKTYSQWTIIDGGHLQKDKEEQEEVQKEKNIQYESLDFNSVIATQFVIVGQIEGKGSVRIFDMRNANDPIIDFILDNQQQQVNKTQKKDKEVKQIKNNKLVSVDWCSADPNYIVACNEEGISYCWSLASKRLLGELNIKQQSKVKQIWQTEEKDNIIKKQEVEQLKQKQLQDDETEFFSGESNIRNQKEQINSKTPIQKSSVIWSQANPSQLCITSPKNSIISINNVYDVIHSFIKRDDQGNVIEILDQEQEEELMRPPNWMNIKMNINVDGEDKKKQQIIPCIGSALGISLFGGRVITVSIPQLTKADESIKSVIEIRNVVNQEENKVEEGLDIYQQIYQLEESLNKDQLIEYCLKKSQNNEIQEEQQNESQQSKTIWKILAHILIGKQKGRSIRKELLQLLGMDVSKLQTIGEKKEKIQLRKKKRQQRREEEQKKKEEEQRRKIEEEKRIKEEEERKKKELDNLRQKAFQLQSDDDDASSFFDREEQLNKEQKTDKQLNEQTNKEEQKDENKEKEESSSKEKQSKSKQVIKEHWQKAAIQYKKDQNKKQLNKEIENLLITGDIKGASILCLSSGLDILALQLADLVWNNDQDDKLNRKNRKKGQQKKEEEEQDELTFRDKIRIAVRKKAKQEWRFMELLEKIELQNDVGKDKRTDIEGEEEGNQLKPLIYEESLKNERLWIEKEEGKQNKKKNKGKKQKEEEEEEDDDDLESDSDEQEEKDNKLIIEQDIDIQNPLDDLEQEEQEEESKFSSFGWRKELSVILTYCCDDDLIDEITFMIESEEEKKKQELNEQNNKKSDINDDEIIDEYNDTYLLLLHLLAGNIQQAFKLWNGFDKQTTQSSSSEQNIQKQQLKRLERQLILLNVYPYEIYEREKIKIIEPLIWQVGQYSNQLLEQGNIIESKKFIESVLNILNGVQILEQDQEVNLTKVLISLLVKLRNRIHQSFFTERKEIDSIAQQELKITLSREEQILIQGRKKQNEIEEKKKRQNRERIEQQRKKELIEEEQRKKIEKEKKIKIERDQFEQEEQIKRQNVKKIEHIEQQQEYKSSITPPAPLSLSQQAPQLRAKDTNPYPNQQDILPPPLNLSTNQQQGRIQQQQQQQQQQPQYHGPKKSNIGGGRDALIQIEPQSQHTKSIAMMNAAPPKNTQQSQQSDNSNINHGQTEFVDRKEDKRIEQQGQKDANERQVGSGTTEKLNQQADQQQQKQLLLGQVSTVKFINTLTKMQKFSEEMELEDESMRPVAVGLSQLIQTITPQQFTETNHLGQLKDIRDRILELIKRMASGQGDKALSSEHKDLLKKVVELSLQGSFDEATHVQRQIVAEHWEQASGYVTHLKKLITELQKRVLPH